MGVEIGVPATGELSPSSKAVGQVMNPNHSGSSSEAAQGLKYFDVGLPLYSLLVAALERSRCQQKDWSRGRAILGAGQAWLAPKYLASSEVRLLPTQSRCCYCCCYFFFASRGQPTRAMKKMRKIQAEA